jgi:DNA phosphorothioation-dependent restriction protein DptH
VPVADPEPKATVALLARLLLGEEENAAPSVGKEAAKVLAEEVRRYRQLHPDYRRLQVHALRAGDAMPVARALGQALPGADEEEALTPSPSQPKGVRGAYPAAHPTGRGEEEEQEKLCYQLDLYPAAGQSTELTGRFLSATAERRRSGAGAVPSEDRWLLESVPRPGGVTLPRLRWARRASPQPETPAHLALAFDLFRSRVVCQPQDRLPAGGVLEAHGLSLMPSREFQADPNPCWRTFIPPDPVGEKHPSTRVLTDRQVKLHNTLLRATARHLGGNAGDWPVLLTEVSAEQGELLEKLHDLCDWVITADRNAGIEYFDSPQELPKLYEAYIIDCVPEREDLGFLQLITSTSRFDEVVHLLDETLGEMGLSASPRNCRFLLDALKGISGRLALRLSGSGHAAQEMIALALAHAHCRAAREDDAVWRPLSQGFWVPLDDVPELLGKLDKSQADGQQRADLLYVKASKSTGLQCAFVEVKFRRYLKTARAPELIEGMQRQVEASCQRWEKRFGARTSALEKTVRRANLARILRFYARKGRRHGLSEPAFQIALTEIDRLVRERETSLPRLNELQRVGYVFCPEYRGRDPAEIGQNIWMFGPELLPEAGQPSVAALSARTMFSRPEQPSESLSKKGNAVATVPEASLPKETLAPPVAKPPGIASEKTPLRQAGILLGHQAGGGEVIWRPAVQGNPHLMILGLPGMGKTHCLINLCLQLSAQGISPIVFSYHQDIDQRLSEQLPTPPRQVRYAGLGFNPLRVPEGQRYLDSVAMLRDLFAAIFPELGEVQLGRLRTALKQSYADQGWDATRRGEVPMFRAFFDLLQADPKPDRNLLVRLSELEEYGLFDTIEGASSLLEESGTALVQIHETQNEALQRAFAILTLYNLYQNMFRRGLQTRITHAVIFDEAHKAAKLKLIPKMARECRKYGLAFVLASQEAKDFDPSLFTAVANYLALRLDETDARLMAKKFTSADKLKDYTDRIKQLPKYHGIYYGEGLRSPIHLGLLAKV